MLKAGFSSLYIFISFFEEEAGHIALHMSVSPFVSRPFRFQSITSLDLPSSCLVNTSILGSRGSLLLFGSLGQGSRSNFAHVFWWWAI